MLSRAHTHHPGSQLPAAPPRRSASALIVVLWCVVILAIVTMTTLRSTRLELRISRNFGDREQAYYLALAGVETAKAWIYRESEERKTSVSSYRSKLGNDAPRFRRREARSRFVSRDPSGARRRNGRGPRQHRLRNRGRGIEAERHRREPRDARAASRHDERDGRRDHRLARLGSEAHRRGRRGRLLLGASRAVQDAQRPVRDHP